jgi:hypothetical protein
MECERKLCARENCTRKRYRGTRCRECYVSQSRRCAVPECRMRTVSTTSLHVNLAVLGSAPCHLLHSLCLLHTHRHCNMQCLLCARPVCNFKRMLCRRHNTYAWRMRCSLRGQSETEKDDDDDARSSTSCDSSLPTTIYSSECASLLVDTLSSATAASLYGDDDDDDDEAVDDFDSVS